MPPSAASAVAMAHSPRLHTLLSFDRGADALALPAAGDEDGRITRASDIIGAEDDEAVVASFDFDFAFAPPVAAGDLAPADDIFAHGRIVPAYLIFDRRLLDLSPDEGETREVAATTAPPSADTYCRWAPRSAPGSPARDRFPKSASTGGESSSSRRWRLRDLVGAGSGRSRSDGKDKFAFLHHHHAAVPPSSKLKTTPPPQPPQQQKKQSAVKKPAAKKGVVTEMDMATAHKLFYSKAGAGAGERRPQQASYLPYRPAFSGFFALGRSQHHAAY